MFNKMINQMKMILMKMNNHQEERLREVRNLKCNDLKLLYIIKNYL